jgi:hypothetical protein
VRRSAAERSGIRAGAFSFGTNSPAGRTESRHAGDRQYPASYQIKVISPTGPVRRSAAERCGIRAGPFSFDTNLPTGRTKSRHAGDRQYPASYQFKVNGAH